MRKSFPTAILLVVAFSAAADDRVIVETEQIFADFLDAHGALETIDSGLSSQIESEDRAAWQRRRDETSAELQKWLKNLGREQLTPSETRVVSKMQLTFDELSDPGAAMAPDRKCHDATRPERDVDVLQAALYACFDEIGNRLDFEGEPITRGGALQRLQEIEEPARRKALFMALAPLWAAVNGKDDANSPYRRMIALAATAFANKPSPIDEAAQALNADSQRLEAWLIELLDAWRSTNEGGDAIEPWDYRYQHARASRALNASIPREVLAPLNQRFFADLGADPHGLGVLFDLDPRPGKAPIAYADTVRIGRTINDKWRPAIARISANYDHGGLYTLNELTHETGHAVHYMAIRARPAYFWTDTLFIEAFADVPSWSVFEPAWQQKYLGRSVSRADGLRELYSLVMLDVAWGLFELRMLRTPATDPNLLWTEITSRYLGVAPHPELSWWAVRAQLGSNPGYMINYAIGAIITAEIRKRTRDSIGSFDAGNDAWYSWTSEQLLKFGAELDTAQLLERFLGRPLSATALVEELASIRREK
ncbi:MAG TPA: hypothetical protein VLB75_05665 [Steroidobacteraceae bacterium]|nr:hypothetical protein [Steroidobacteraceae bacterium]